MVVRGGIMEKTVEWQNESFESLSKYLFKLRDILEKEADAIIVKKIKKMKKIEEASSFLKDCKEFYYERRKNIDFLNLGDSKKCRGCIILLKIEFKYIGIDIPEYASD